MSQIDLNMKNKFLLIALLASAMMIPNTATAQQNLHFGVKAGLNVTDMKLDTDVFKKSNQIGWFFGPTVKLTLPIVGLGVDGSILYDHRAAKVTTEGESKDIKQDKIAIPINARYSIGLGSSLNVLLYAGPQWGINVGDKDFKWKDKRSYSLNKSSFSVNIGAGVTLVEHLQITANYNIVLGKSADVTFQEASKILHKDSRNNSWQIGVAYFF